MPLRGGPGAVGGVARSTRIATSRYGTAAVFKEGSWGLVGMGGIQIFTPRLGRWLPSNQREGAVPRKKAPSRW